jgi:hypothetical protein
LCLFFEPAKHQVPHPYSAAEESAASLTGFGMTRVFLFCENSLTWHGYNRHFWGPSTRARMHVRTAQDDRGLGAWAVRLKFIPCYVISSQSTVGFCCAQLGSKARRRGRSFTKNEGVFP